MDSKPGSAPVDVPGSETALSVLTVLTKRADFLRAARARRQAAPGFLLQARRRTDDEAVVSTARRVGFTCSKKVGNAVTRNRAKRRLRALARAVLAVSGQPGWDYVLVGRPEATVSRDFADLLTDLERAITAIHKPRSATGGTP